MKYYFFLLCTIFPLFGCAHEDKSTTYSTHQEQTVTITGEVIKKTQQGTDGAVWQVETKEKQLFEVMLSIPNLGEKYSRALGKVKKGAIITVTGEQFTLNKKSHITARTLFVN